MEDRIVVVFPIVSTPEYRINVIVTWDLLKDAANVLLRSYSMHTYPENGYLENKQQLKKFTGI